ncbi:MAG: DUF1552 domain-containing protein [Alphaproteobacteria bacterium]|nr:DUF1552 domain-containing protein [Alphaproteobacteria bacterium]
MSRSSSGLPTRRRFLRGLLAGSAVSVALPPLLSLSGRSDARAATDAFPRRFGLFFWGNGILPERWVPEQEGPGFALSDQLAPLADVAPHLALLTGFQVKVPNRVAHGSGPAGLLSGMPAVDLGDNRITFAGPSLDQVLADAIGRDTRYRSLEVAVQPGGQGRSYRGPNLPNPAESDPATLFERLFGPSFRAPGEDGVVDPRLALRRSVLDAVLQDAAELSPRLGSEDRVRLEQHLDGVRELEVRIARLAEDPPQLDACVRPDPPAAVPDVDGRPQMSEHARVMADLSVMALACDQTRVLSYWFSDPLNDVLFPGTTAGHHQLTHDEPGDQPQVHEIVLEGMQALAYLLGRLRDVPEGDATLLDHCAVLATTDVSYGRTHQLDEFPLIVAGSAGGRLRTGFHHRSASSDNAGRVPLTLLRALDVPAADWGVDDAWTDKGLGELEA